MTNRLAHILLSLLAVALTIVSCISDREVCTDSSQSDDKVQVKFTIAMDNGNTATRGTWDTDINANGQSGSYYENTIEQGKLQVLVYKHDDTNGDQYIGQVEDASYIRRSDTENNIYDVLGTLPIDKSDIGEGKTMNAKIVVLANYDNAATPNKGDKITAITNTYSYKHDAMAATTPTAYIPMWGIKNVTLNLTPGTNTDIGDIYMLRAMAKIKVSIASGTGYTLQSVTLTDHNPNGNIVPNISTGSNENFLTHLEIEKGTETLDADASFNPATRTGDDATVKTASFWQDTDGSYIIYVPEYKQGTTPASLTVEISNDEGKTKTSYSMALQTYNESGVPDGKNLDLVRNTIYSYTITKIGSEELYVQFAKEPWEQVTSQIGWDAQNGVDADFVFYAWPSTDNSSVIKDIKDVQNDGTKGDSEAPVCILNYPRYENTAHTTLKFNGTSGTYYDGEASAASYYFKLTKPVGAVWQAYLINDNWKDINKDTNGNLIAENDSNFRIALGGDAWLNKSGETKYHYSVSTGIAREEPYLIKIMPRHSWYQISGATDFNDDNDDDQLTDYGAAWQRYAKKHDLNLEEEEDKPAKCWIRYYKDENSTAAYVGGPHVDLRIRITLDGTHWYDLAINPEDQKKPGTTNDLNTYYSDGRRFAVGDESSDDFHIRIWQVKTRTKMYNEKGKKVEANAEDKGLGYDRLSDDNPENITMNDQWSSSYPYDTKKYYTTKSE